MKKRVRGANLRAKQVSCPVKIVLLIGLALGVFAASHSDLQAISGILKKFDKAYNRIHSYVDTRVVKQTFTESQSDRKRAPAAAVVPPPPKP